MAVRGFGSLNSPIVISDDEEAAFVEQQLGGFDTAEDDWRWQSEANNLKIHNGTGGQGVMQMGGTHGHPPNPVVGQKRKWVDMAQAGLPPVPQAPPTESKSARKKRRRRERQANQPMVTPPSFSPVLVPPPLPATSSMPFPMPMPPPLPLLAPIPAPLPSPLPTPPSVHHSVPHVASLPSKPQVRHRSGGLRSETRETAPFPEILPPYSWTARPADPVAAPPKPYVPSLPPKPLPITPSLGANGVSYPSPSGSSHQGSSAGTGSYNPFALRPETSSDQGSQVITPPAPLAQTLPPTRKPIGMPQDSDPKARHGLYSSSHMQFTPDPARTLVLEPLPKKFRNVPFVQSWAKRFAQSTPLRIDVESKVGKALIEFRRGAMAQAAFASARLSGEGKEHIRAWWFRSTSSNKLSTVDLEEGEIEESVVEQEQQTEIPATSKKKGKQKQKQKTSKKKGPENVNNPYVSPEQVDEDALLAALFRPRPQPNISQPPESRWPTRPSRVSQNALSHVAADAYPPPVTYDERSATSETSMSAQAMGKRRSWTPDYGARASRNTDDQAMDLESTDGGYDAEEEHTDEPIASYVAMEDDNDSIASSRASEPPADPEILPDEPFHPPDGPSGTRPVLNLLKIDIQSLASRKILEEAKRESMAPSSSQSSMVAPKQPLPEISASIAFASTSQLTIPSSLSQPAEPPSEVYTQVKPAIPSSSTAVPSSVAPPVLHTDRPATDENSTTASSRSKRLLMERQKELEERISQVKEELARRAFGGMSTSRSVEAVPSPADMSQSKNSDSNMVADSTQAAAEESLRRSVIESRSRALNSTKSTSAAPSHGIRGGGSMLDASAAPFTPAVLSRAIPIVGEASSATVSASQSRSLTPAVEVVGGDPSDAALAPASAPSGASLDELAISFITETLQTVQAPQPVAPPPPRATPSMEKMLLAAKQKRLEQHIAESKILMAKLSTARSKEERENILGILRERRRAMDEDMKAESSLSLSSKPSPIASPAPSVHQQSMSAWKMRWPETPRDTILVISDDDDEEDDSF